MTYSFGKGNRAMSFMLSPIIGLVGGAGAAGTAAAGAAAGTAAAGAASGISLASILSGGATVLGLVSSIAAAQAEKEQMDLAAADAEAEMPLETLKGIDRRRSIKQATAEAIGEMDVAYAASGVDLSFGTAAQARTEAFREADLALTSDSGTTMTRLARLQERAANYRRMGKRALRAGVLTGLASGLSSASRLGG